MTSRANGWSTIRLGQVMRVKHGYAFRGEHFGEDGHYVVVTPGNFHEEGGFKSTAGKEKRYTIAPPSEYVLHEGDLVVAMTEQSEGLLGSSALIPVGDKFLHNQRIGLIQLDRPDLADKGFLYHLLNTRPVRAQIQATATGAKVRHTAPERIASVTVSLPPIGTQRKIAAVLLPYEELIKVNERRIDVLAAMGRAIFDKWFPYRRLPGGAIAAPAKSGWRIAPLGSVLRALESGSRPPGGADQIQRDVPSVGAENVLGLGRYDYRKEKFVSRGFFNAMRRGKVESGDVVLYKDGAYIGRVSMFRDGFPHEVCSVNEHVFILRASESFSQNFLFFWLSHPAMMERVRGLSANAAQPGINQSAVRGLPILVPNVDVLQRFDGVAEPLLAQIFNLAKTNAVLRSTRNLLFPKLMSGDLNVNDVETNKDEVA